MQSRSSCPLVLPALLVMLSAAACESVPRASRAASIEVKECALCAKPIPAGEAVLLVAESETSYFRCPHCALTAQAQLEGSSVLTAHSPSSGAAIQVLHDENGWSVDPRSAVFLSLPETAGECIDRHRVFGERDEFDAYLSEHPEFEGQSARAYALGELVQILAAGLPEDAGAPAGARELEVQVVVVGMTTHLPFKSNVLPEIVAALAPFEGRVGLQFVDATQPAGLAILGAHGIHEHSPVVIFINGESEFSLAGREIRLQGFPGEFQWSRTELGAILESEFARSRD